MDNPGPLWPARFAHSVRRDPGRTFAGLFIATCVLLLLVPGLLLAAIAQGQSHCLWRVLVGSVPALALITRVVVQVRRTNRAHRRWQQERMAPPLPERTRDAVVGCWISPEGVFTEYGTCTPWRAFTGYHLEDDGSPVYRVLLFSAHARSASGRGRRRAGGLIGAGIGGAMALGAALEAGAATQCLRLGAGAGALLAGCAALLYLLATAQLISAGYQARRGPHPRSTSITLTVERNVVAPQDLTALLGEHVSAADGDGPAEESAGE